MSLVHVEGLCLSFGERTLFSNAGFRIGLQDRIGLVGPNGSGKSTLFRLIEGKIEPDRGSIARLKGIRIGHLPQDIVEVAGDSPIGTVLSMLPGRDELIRTIARIEGELAESEDSEQQMELAWRLAQLHEERDRFDGTYSEHEAKRILMGLGFSDPDLKRPLAEFSSGWIMRVALAGVLFQRPDLMLLDEPTNHLDVPSMAWLDGFLREFGHAVALISHDRVFLNRQIGRIIALEPEGLRTHTGDFDSYREARDRLEEDLRERARRQQEQIEKAQRFIDRFRAKNTKAKAVQSKIRALEKLQRVQVLQHRRTIRFKFPEVPKSGKEALRLDRVCKSFGDLVLYRDLNEAVLRGERIAIVGRNGAGKTTLMRIMSGEVDPDQGEVHWGHNVTMATYSQRHADSLSPEQTVLESVWGLIPSMPQTEVRGVLGAFLFSGDDVDKQIGVLSGGERARVALARLLVRPANLMLLDEPTNHLDLESSEMLAQALDDFEGTLIFVSHNRSFVNRLATRVWELDQGRLNSFPGDLDDYLWHKERNEAQDQVEGEEGDQEEAKDSTKPETAFQRRKRMAYKIKQVRAELREIIRQADGLERQITALEEEQAELSRLLADSNTYKDDERTRSLVGRFKVVRDSIAELTVEWEHQVEQAHPLQSKLEALAREAEGVESIE